MDGWWYLRDDERIGPVSTAALQHLYQQALVDARTLVWQEGMAAWLPLGQVAALDAAMHAVPPPAPVTADAVLRQELPMAGRWRRFFARLFDLGWECLLVALAAGFLLDAVSAGFVAWTNLPGWDEAFVLLSLPFALALDALCYAAFGNTPGKALLGLQLTSIRGERLTLAACLIRNLRLWASGLGLGIPVVSLFTLARQSGRLHKGMQASYDEEAGDRVHARPIGRGRRAAFGTAFGAFALLLGASWLAGLEDDIERAGVAAQKFYVWNNPDTGEDVLVDARWEFASQTNAYGTRMFVFTERTDHAQAIFGPEDAPGMSLSKYVDGFLYNMDATMRFDDRGRFAEREELPVWEGRGTMPGRPGSVLLVRILQIDDTFWRFIVVQEPPVDYSSPLVDFLEQALWDSVLPHAPRPTT